MSNQLEPQGGIEPPTARGSKHDGERQSHTHHQHSTADGVASSAGLRENRVPKPQPNRNRARVDVRAVADERGAAERSLQRAGAFATERQADGAATFFGIFIVGSICFGVGLFAGAVITVWVR